MSDTKENQTILSECCVLLAWFISFAALVNLTNHKADGKSMHSFAGPYIPQVSKVYGCDGGSFGGSIWKLYARLSHYNPLKPTEPQRIHSGNMTLLKPIDDSYWLRVILDKRNNNQWKENAFVFYFPSKGCTNIFQYAAYTTVLYGKLLKGKNPCVISPGVNMFNNTVIHIDYPSVPVMPYMDVRMRGTMNVIGITTPAVCFVLEASLIPKA